MIYSTLFYYFFAFTGHRQTIATAIVVFIGYEYVKKRKFIPFSLITLLAFTIHKSSLIFFPFYFIANFNITRMHIITSLVCFPFLILFRIPIASNIMQLSGYNYGLHEGAGTYNFYSYVDSSSYSKCLEN